MIKTAALPPLTFRALVAATAPLAAPATTTPQRKDQATLSATEQDRFLTKIKIINQRGLFGQLVSIHSDMGHIMHNMGDADSALGQQRFLPWHRVYLSQLEQLLQLMFDPPSRPETTIPYWDWSNEEEQTIPRFLQGLDLTVPVAAPVPGMGVMSIPVTVVRAPLTQAELKRRVSGLDAVMAATTYTEFATGLENIHNAVHDWVGGTMDDLTTASADPIFWMHHANIDRLWWKWQQTHAGLNPDVSGLDAILDPWRSDEPQTRDIANFNYGYA